MVKLLMMGPPGVGKGTFSALQSPRRLSKAFSIPTVSLGDEIRRIVAQKHDLPLYRDLAVLVGKGTLINDGLAWAILTHTLGRRGDSQGFIIDGYPRTIAEAEIMDLSDFQYDLVVSLGQKEEVIVQKIKGRRVCEDCGTNYNVAHVQFEGYSLPSRKPRVEGKCDGCAGKLVQRPDDSMRVIKRRLFEFKVKTAPLEEYYERKGKLVKATVFRGVDDFPDLLGQIQGRLSKV